MDFLNTYSNFWSVIESVFAILTFLFAIFLFLNDPLRRWKFLGFRPTVMIILFDPKLKKILLIKDHEWSFCQGSIYGQDITQAIENTLIRELGLNTSLYRIFLVNPLGTVSIKNRKRTTRIALGTVSIFQNIIGKGYIGCFLDTDLKQIKKHIKLGYNIPEFGIFNVKEARKKLQEIPSPDNPFKQKIYIKAFKTLNSLFDNWQSQKRSI